MEKRYEITEHQLQQVEEYLQKKKFDFIDLNVEILDHIISDIENLLNKNYAFEDAFAMVRIRWEKHFRETSSFYFGLHYSESKIVVKKAIKMFKPFFILYMAAYFLPVVIFTKFSIVFSESTSYFLNGFMNSITSILIVYLIFIIVKVIRSKVKTTYRFILKTQYLGIFFLVVSLFMGNRFNYDGTLIPFLIGFQCAGFTVTYICHHFYKKHKEAIQNYKHLLN